MVRQKLAEVRENNEDLVQKFLEWYANRMYACSHSGKQIEFMTDAMIVRLIAQQCNACNCVSRAVMCVAKDQHWIGFRTPVSWNSSKVSLQKYELCLPLKYRGW